MGFSNFAAASAATFPSSSSSSSFSSFLRQRFPLLLLFAAAAALAGAPVVVGGSFIDVHTGDLDLSEVLQNLSEQIMLMKAELKSTLEAVEADNASCVCWDHIPRVPLIDNSITSTTTSPAAATSLCSTFGDPHFVTFDGATTVTMREGTIWAVKSKDIWIQAMAVTSAGNLMGLAIGGPFLKNHTLGIYNLGLYDATSEGQLEVIWDGEEILGNVDATGSAEFEEPFLLWAARRADWDPSLHDEAVLGIKPAIKFSIGEWSERFLDKPKGGLLLFKLPNDVEITLTGVDFMSVAISMPAQETQSGHCGNYNGDPDDDFEPLPEGAVPALLAPAWNRPVGDDLEPVSDANNLFTKNKASLAVALLSSTAASRLRVETSIADFRNAYDHEEVEGDGREGPQHHPRHHHHNHHHHHNPHHHSHHGNTMEPTTDLEQPPHRLSTEETEVVVVSSSSSSSTTTTSSSRVVDHDRVEERRLEAIIDGGSALETSIHCPWWVIWRAKRKCSLVQDEQLRAACAMDICAARLPSSEDKLVDGAADIEVLSHSLLSSRALLQFEGHGRCLTRYGAPMQRLKARDARSPKACQHLLSLVSGNTDVVGAQQRRDGPCEILLSGHPTPKQEQDQSSRDIEDILIEPSAASVRKDLIVGVEKDLAWTCWRLN
mmetsp:Transcript_28223/g.60110  ORF Transcript_28223/g.60110 Transcript_28223/m.60110 type:complete len:660 (-) Transcript_28223:796-2775(-)